MRNLIILLAMAGVTACNKPVDTKAEQADLVPAALSFDGADYRDDAAKLAHGKRLARVLDCTGCHGDNLQGHNVTEDEPEYGDMNAPNLTLLMPTYSDAEFEKLLRHGVPRDGREFYFMPPESYQFLSDADMKAILAFVRSFPPAGKQLPPIRKGEGFLQEMKEGGIKPAAQQVVRYRDNPPPDLGPEFERGRQLARMTCTGCHNGELQGYEGFTPNLDIAGTYNAAELTELLTSGKGKAKPDPGLMTSISKYSFSALTPAERKAIVEYVLARANRPQHGLDGRD
jgi:mono/diheme cytochrome c family protein